MPIDDTRALLKRAVTAWDRKLLWKPLRDDAYHFAMSHRNLYASNRQEGRDQARDVWDSQATISAQRSAARFQQGMAQEGERWFELRPGPAMNEGQAESVKDDLERATELALAAQEVGGFYQADNECWQERLVGTAVCLVNRGPVVDRPATYHAIPEAEVAFEEGPYGSIDGEYRRHEMTARLIQRTWPDIQELPRELEQAAERNSQTTYQLVELTYFDPEPKRDDVTGKAFERVYEVIWKNPNSNAEPMRLVRRFETEDPWIVSRFDRTPGEVEGRGPVTMLLPDIRTLNATKKMLLQRASLQMYNPLLIGEAAGLDNPDMIVWADRALIDCEDPSAITQLPMGDKFDLSQIVLGELKESVREGLYDVALPPLEGAVKSATEIIARVRRAQGDLGGAFARTKVEHYERVIARTLSILHRWGLVPKIAIGVGVKVQMVGFLARAQALRDAEAIVNWLQIMMSLGGQALVVAVARLDDAMAKLGEALGVPSELILPKDERENLQKMVAGMLGADAGPAAALAPVVGAGAGAS